MNNKQFFYISLVLIFGIVLLTISGCSSKNQVAISDEETQFFGDDFDAAVEYYTKALAENPDDIELKVRLLRIKQKASIFHMRTAQELISKNYYKEGIEELQLAVAFYPNNHRAIELIDKAKKSKEAAHYVTRGYKLVKMGDFKKAKVAFQKAISLDPENGRALAAIEKYQKKPEELNRYQVEIRDNRPISMKFKKTPIINVFEILSKISGINFIFDKDIKESKVTLFMTDVKFDRFLDVLLETNAMKAKAINKKTLLIYPDTPQKAKEYNQLYVKTFYLSYMKAKDIAAVLTKILKSKDVFANEKMNAVTIRGTKEIVDVAEKLIVSNDRTPSEVVLNVEILEVSRTKEKDLGLSISDTITFGISETSSGIDFDTDFGLAQFGSINDISKISSKELYLSLPTATLKLLKRDGDTKTLAKPQLRVSSSEKASILIGEKIPLRTNRRVQTDGSITYDFQYQDVGVKLAAEPVINMFNQVTMKLSIEISSLGNNVGTVTDPQYAINTRSTSTVLTILDGDSVIIGGLIQDTDRSTVQKIPGLGDVPAFGKIFSTTSSEVENKDILMAITPVIIRNQDIPENIENGFWTGSEENVSLEVPEEKVLEQENRYHDVPAEDFVMAVTDDVFLPSDNYYSIQVYSTKEEKEAEKKSEELTQMGFQTWMRPAEVKDKGTFYRVFVGQFDSYRMAENKRIELLQQDIFRRDIHIVDRAYVYGE